MSSTRNQSTQQFVGPERAVARSLSCSLLSTLLIITRLINSDVRLMNS